MLNSARARRRRIVALVGTASLGLLGALAPAIPAAADTAPVPPVTTPTVSADALPTVQINGVVWAQVIVGNRVYATGQFTSARPAGSPAGSNETARSNILAYDLTTGALITSWAPSLNGQGLAIAASPDGSRIYVAGDFLQVNGVNRSRLAALDANTGALVTSFAANLNARARALAVTSGAVYVGGTFTTAAGQPRQRLAAVAPANGALLSWAPVADAEVMSMTLPSASGKVIVGGRFGSLNGDTNNYGLGALDASTGAVLPWVATSYIKDAGTTAAVYHLSSDGAQVYGAGYTFGPGNFEGSFAATTSTGDITWINSCRGDVYSVASLAGVLYSVGHPHDCGMIGGHPQTEPWTFQRAMATTSAPAADGRVNTYGGWAGWRAPEVLHWLPTVDAGSYTGQTQGAWTVTGNSQYVLLGGEFPRINGTGQQGLVRFAIKDLAPNTQGPQGHAQLTPTLVSLAPGTVRVSWQAAWDRDNRRLTYEVLRGSAVLATFTADSAWWDRPPLAYTDTTAPTGSTQTYRVRVKDAFANTLTGATASITVPGGTATPSAYGNAVRADSPLTYWPLGEASGNTGFDWVGADDLTLDASAQRGTAGAIVGESTTATTFSGGATVPAAARTLRAGPQTFSAEAWFKTTTTSGGKIIGFGASNTGTSNSYDRHVYMTNEGNLVFGVYPGGVRTVSSPLRYNDGQWHHVVATLGSGGMSFYVDAKRVASRSDTTSAEGYSGYWRIGGDNIGGWPSQPASSSFAGAIDEAAVYPIALPLSAVQAHYNASGRTVVTPQRPTDAYGRAVWDAEPDLYWRLDETSGTSARNTMTAEASATYSAGVALGQDGSPAAPAGKSIGLPGGFHTVVANDAVGNPQVYSLQAWFKTTTTSGGRIIGFGNAPSGTTSGNYDRHVYMLDSGQLRYGIWTGTASIVDSPASYNDGQWHQLVATQGPGGQQLFVDGQLVGSGGAVSPQGYDGYWRIGGDNTWGGASTNDFAGSVDEVAVYPSVLPAATVTQHWQLGSGTPPPNQEPTAVFAETVDDLTVSFDGSGSSDPDGTIASYGWDFGDGATGTGATATHAYTAAGTYTVILTVTDDDGGTDTASRSVTVTAPPPVDPAVARDTFERTVASGLGSADLGGAWTVSGSGTVTSVGGGSGRAAVPVGRTATFRLPAVSNTDTDLVHAVWTEAQPTGGGVYLSSIARATAAGDYRSRLRIMPTGQLFLNLSRMVGTTETSLSTQVTVPGITYTAGMKLMVRTQAVGTSPTTVRAKVWVEGSTEPAAWLQTVTDATGGLQGPGSVGLVDYVSGTATATIAIRYDNLIAVKL